MDEMYPDILITTVTANGTKNAETGDWTQGAQTQYTMRCRAESDSNNGYITDEDGQRIDFSWILYLPKATPPVPIGATAKVTSYGQVILTDSVKRFKTGRFNCRIWL